MGTIVLTYKIYQVYQAATKQTCYFSMMAQKGTAFQPVLPKQGQLFQEDCPALVLCKPKLMPLKSVTLEKLEKMQHDAQETVKQQEAEAQAEAATMFAGMGSQGMA